MNRKNENSNLLKEKVLMIGLFLIIIFAFKSTAYAGKNSLCQRTPIAYNLDVDKSAIFGKAAILVSQISSKDFNSTVVACEIFTLNLHNKNNFLVVFSNNKVNQSLKNCKEQFLEIKPRISDSEPYHVRTSINTEEIPSIS
jgi:hypothetical protein